MRKDVIVRRRSAMRAPGRAGRLALALARGPGRGRMRGGLALLDRFLEDLPRGALRPVLKHERDILDASPQRRVPEKHVAPQLGQQPRRVAARAQAKVANHHAPHVIVRANGQRRAELAAREIALVVERVGCPAFLELGPFHGHDGHDGELAPVFGVTRFVAVMGSAEDDWGEARSATV